MNEIKASGDSHGLWGFPEVFFLIFPEDDQENDTLLLRVWVIFIEGMLNNKDSNGQILPGRHWQLIALVGSKSPLIKAAVWFSASRRGPLLYSRKASWHYVSAHGPKRAKLVRPKVQKTGEDATGGFFQQTHS